MIPPRCATQCRMVGLWGGGDGSGISAIAIAAMLAAAASGCDTRNERERERESAMRCDATLNPLTRRTS
uniref:Uncharacterized protein n=1 Tax=Physcomitrium patens TaxID=3218 RepID=A0A2K1J0P0_PHYPA|nr:hypothetical protein PHYPA_022992 [Physcomitrium patens]